MPALQTILCPKCSAPVEFRPGSATVTCTYCGVTSVTTSSRTPSARPPPAPQAHAPTFVITAMVTLLLALVAGGVVMAMVAARRPAPVATQTSANAPVIIPIATLAPPRETPVTQVLSGITPIVADIDGNRQGELIVGIRSTLAGVSTEHFAVFDPRTGAERTRTPAFEDASRLLVAALGNRLVLAGEHGQLTGYDLVSGRAQWTTTLGDRVNSMCESGTVGAMHVETADQRRLVVDLVTGRQAETREPCTRRLADGESFRNPRDRHDYDAPAGVESYYCGGTTVMGSENYTVPDPCLARAHVNTDRLDGINGSRLWRVPGGWLIFGIRSPGAHVPMVGRLGRGSTFVWKSEVPLSNPLQAEMGGPRNVALVGDALIVAYATDGQPHSYVTAFALADGVRRLTIALIGDEPVRALVPVGDAVAVQIGKVIKVLAVADGSVRATIGVAD